MFSIQVHPSTENDDRLTHSRSKDMAFSTFLGQLEESKNHYLAFWRTFPFNPHLLVERTKYSGGKNFSCFWNSKPATVVVTSELSHSVSGQGSSAAFDVAILSSSSC
ncbi:hypothetical protein NC652_012805 [Populus alba x Populus x berolinensis]|nr:hypothetical protein NC652_012805 [Populus alba x Populus x berolinensis]